MFLIANSWSHEAIEVLNTIVVKTEVLLYLNILL